MSHFYQGYCRCKDFFGLLKDMFSANGWNVIDTNAPTTNAHEYIVVQRLSSRGEIMTIGLKHRSHYQIYIKPSYSTNTNQSNGVYSDAYDVSTHTLKHTIGYYNNANSQLNITTTNYSDSYSDWQSRAVQQHIRYYTTAYTDTDAEPKYLFYIISFDADNFVIKVRGNPATSGVYTEMIYCGPAVIDSSILVEPPTGKWCVCVCQNLDGAMQFMLSKNPQSAAGWVVWDCIAASLDDSDAGIAFQDKNSLLSNQSPYGIPILFRDRGTLKAYPTIWLDPSFILATQRKGTINYTDEQKFVTIDNSKFVFLNSANNHDQATYFIKVMDYPTNITAEDTGTAYKISWTNPPAPADSNIILCAQTDTYPSAPTEGNTIAVFSSVSPGATQSYFDSDLARYGNDVYYGVFSIDNNTTPPQQSLPSFGNRIKIKSNIESLSSIRTLLPAPNGRPTTLDFVSTKPGKLTLYSNPILIYPCDDSTDNNIITDITGNYHGILYNANTSTKSVPAKIGNGIQFGVAPNASIRANNATAMNYKLTNTYGISFWFKLSSNPSEARFFSNNTNVSGLGFGTSPYWGDVKGKTCRAAYWAQSGGYALPYDFSSTIDDNFHHLFFVCNGHIKHLWIDGRPVVSFSSPYNNFLNTDQYLVFGSQGSDVNSLVTPGIMNMIAVYESAPDPIQIQYEYNGGSGRVTNYVPGPNSGLKIIAKPGSMNEKLFYVLDNKTSIIGKNKLHFDVFATRTGQNFKLGFGNDNFTDIESNVEITEANTWITKTIDISTLPPSKRLIGQLAITVLDDTASSIFSVRNITATIG